MQPHVFAGRLERRPRRRLPRVASSLRQSVLTSSMPMVMWPSISPRSSKGMTKPSAGSEFSQSLPESWKSTPATSRSRLSSGIGRGDGQRAPHHLRDMLDETAAPRVMIAARRRRPAKPRRRIRREKAAPARAAAGRRSTPTASAMKAKSAACFSRNSGGPARSGVALVFGEFPASPAFRVEAEGAIVDEFARDFEKGPGCQFLAHRKRRRIAPRPQRHLRFGVGQGQFPEGLAVARLLFHQRFRLAVDGGLDPAGEGAAFEHGEWEDFRGVHRACNARRLAARVETEMSASAGKIPKLGVAKPSRMTYKCNYIANHAPPSMRTLPLQKSRLFAPRTDRRHPDHRDHRGLLTAGGFHDSARARRFPRRRRSSPIRSTSPARSR